MGAEEQYLPYEQALGLVGAIQEEEHLREPNRRILTVYDKRDRELCWFDYQETLEAAAPDRGSDKKTEVQPKIEAYVLHRIPAWVLD